LINIVLFDCTVESMVSDVPRTHMLFSCWLTASWKCNYIHDITSKRKRWPKVSFIDSGKVYCSITTRRLGAITHSFHGIVYAHL